MNKRSMKSMMKEW